MTAGATATAAARVLVVGHEDRAGLGRLAPVLRRRLGPGTVDERRPDLGDPLPAGVADHDGLIVLGGSMAAWDDGRCGWLPRTRALLLDAVARGVPALGICLGAQLLALAAGGTVGPGAAGLEVGVVGVELLPPAADDPLLGRVRAALGRRPRVPQWHQDAITALPPGAVRLVTGDVYPNQAFRVGACAWGLQYHPEVTVEDWQAWNAAGAAAIRGAGRDPADVDREPVAREADLARSAVAHAEAFADLVSARVAGRAAERAERAERGRAPR